MKRTFLGIVFLHQYLRIQSMPLATGMKRLASIIDAPQTRTGALSLGIAKLHFYHSNLSRKEKKGGQTWRSTLSNSRKQWTKFVFESQGWLYAVQTMRNAITANTFLASTSLSLFTVLIGHMLQHKGEVSGMNRLLYFLQFSPVALLLLCSAFNFSQSARLMTHAGFMFPVAEGCGEDGCKTPTETEPFKPHPVTVETLESVLVKSEFLQWYGLRYLYLSACFVLWPLAGEWAFFAAANVFLLFFRSIDKPPPSQFDFYSRTSRKFIKAP